MQLEQRINSRTTLDFFCGAGGMSLGFDNAGYEIVGAVDKNETAVETHRQNFSHPVWQYDLAAVEPQEFAAETGVKPSHVEVVIGGPPCQGFSRANVDRSVDDERNNLVFVFADYVEYYEPETFLMENVKGIQETTMQDEVFNPLLAEFREAGYVVDWKVLNAADYGVPQIRERVFVQGQRNGDVQWPKQTHAPADEIKTVADGGTQ